VSSYEGSKGDRFKVKPTDKTEQDVSYLRSLRPADLYALIEDDIIEISDSPFSNLLSEI
jgi:hypothetical protein